MDKEETDNSPIIGIDLGTTNSCVAVVIDNKVKIIHNDVGKNTTPSYVAFTEKGRYVGEQAKQLSIIDPENVVYDSKRIIGRKFLDSAVQTDRQHWPFIVYNNHSNPMIQVGKGIHKKFTPEAISAMILEKMKKIAEDYLGVPVNRAIITVPARFNVSQRKATIDAGKIAGLNVQKIITEPTAAAIAYSIQQNCTKKSHILVFDLGGGTFDVSVLRTENKRFQVLASDGDTHLGGEDFDNRLVDYMITEFKNKHKKDPSVDKKAMRRLKAKCEQAKETLSVSEEANITIDMFYDNIDFQMSITRSRFNWINKNLFEECIDTVKNTLDKLEFTKKDIDHVILVGGSTRIVKIQDMLQEFFEGKILNKSLNPDEAIAYGAALHASQLSDLMSIESFQLQDVAPLSIGMPKRTKEMVFWIKRNTPLPTSVVKPCFTVIDNQVNMIFKIYEGERLISSDNTYLGKFQIKNLSKGLAGKVKVDVQFEVDENGILHITAKEEVSASEKKIKITSNIGRLSDAEVSRIIRDAEKYRQEDKTRSELNAAKNSLETFIINILSRVDNNELQIELSSEELESMRNNCNASLQWVDENANATLEELKEHLVQLKITCNKLDL